MTYLDELLSDNYTSSFLHELLTEIHNNIYNLERFTGEQNIYNDIRSVIIYGLMETNFDELIQLNEYLKENIINEKIKWRNLQIELLYCHETGHGLKSSYMIYLL